LQYFTSSRGGAPAVSADSKLKMQNSNLDSDFDQGINPFDKRSYS
jgi:hypothetical protein